MQKGGEPKPLRKPQAQARPGKESNMTPRPASQPPDNKQGKLHGRVALITGGDSGIGRAVALLFAQEGARVAIAYLSESEDAAETKRMVDSHTECLLLEGDLGKEKQCRAIVDKTVKKFGQLDILVNNAALHWESKSLQEISTEQFENTFHNNVMPYFWVTQAALEHLRKGSCIINTASVTAYRGSETLIDYASTKGAIVSFTRSLSANLAKKGIRVNGVAPGPIWTPLIASTFKPDKVAKFGSDVPMGRAGQPNEVAPSYLFLACSDSAYMTGQFLHPNGGEIVNG